MCHELESSVGGMQLSHERWMMCILCFQCVLVYLREDVLIEGDILPAILWEPWEKDLEQFQHVIGMDRRRVFMVYVQGL